MTNSQILESSTISQDPTSNQICVSASFYTGRGAQGFVTIYHKCSVGNFSLSVSHTSPSSYGRSTRTESCHVVAPGCYWVAVFGVKQDGEMEEQPANITRLQISGVLLLSL